MSTLASLVVRLVGDTSSLHGALGEAESRVERFSGAALRTGAALSAGLTLPIVGIGAAAVNMAADYEQSMNVLQATSEATAAEMETLDGVAQALGADMALPGTSATDAAEAMLEMVKAGMSLHDTMDAARGVLALSAAGELSNAQAAQIAANALNSFHLAGSEASRVADLLAAASNASSAEVYQVAQSLQMASAVAYSAGQSIGDTTTAIAMMANAGIAGSDAGTSLKTMLLSLMAPSDQAAAAMEALGISVYDASGSMLPLPAIVEMFSGALGGMSEAQRNATLSTIFGTDAIRAANIVLMAGRENFDAMGEAVNRQGAAQELAAARMAGLKGAFEGLKSTVESTLLAAALPFLGTLESLIRRVAEFVPQVLSLEPGLRSAGLAFLAVLAAAGPVLLILGAVGSAIGFLLSPIGLVVAAVAVLTAAWASNFGGIRDTVMGWWASIQPALAEAGRILKEVVGAAVERLAALWNEHWPAMRATLEEVWGVVQDILGAAWEALWGNVGTVVEGAITTIEGVIDGVSEMISGTVATVKALLEGDWQGAWEAAKGTVEGVSEGIKTAVTGITMVVDGEMGIIWDTIAGTSDKLLGTDLPKWEEFKAGVVETWENLREGVVEKTEAALKAAEDWLSDTRQAIENFDLKAAAMALFETARDGIVEMAGKMLDRVVEFLDDAFYAIENFDLKAAAKAAFNTVVVGTVERTGEALTKVGTWLSDVRTKINNYDFKAAARAAFNTVVVGTIEKTGEALGKVGTWLSDVATKIREKSFKSETMTALQTVVAGILEKASDIYTEISTMLTTVADTIRGFSLADVGAGLINGLIGGIQSAAAGVAAAAVRVVTDAIAAARAALGIHSPSTVAAAKVGEPFTQGIAQGVLDGMAWLVDAVSTVAGQVETAGVREFAEAARAIAEAVGPAMEAVMALYEQVLPDGGGLDVAIGRFVEVMQRFVERLAAAAALLGAEAMAAASALGAAIGDVTEPIVQGMEALLALGDLTQINGGMIDRQMAAFAGIIGGLVEYMRRAATYFTADGLAAASAFGEAVGPVTEPIVQGMEALLSLGNLAQINGNTIDAGMAAFAGIIGGLVEHMRRAATYFTADGLAAASAFGEAVGKVTEPIVQGMEALVALGGLAQVDGGRIDARMAAFADLMGGMVQHMKRVATYFTADGLAAAAAFGEAVEKVVAPIGDGVAALVELSEAAWGDGALLTVKMAEFAAMMATLAATLAWAAGVTSENAVEAAKRFGTFVANLDGLVEGLLEATDQITGDGLRSAEEFHRAAVGVAEHIIAGLLAAAGIGSAGGGVPAVMAAIVRSVLAAADSLAMAFGWLVSAGWVFGTNWVNAIIGGLQSRLGALEALLEYIRGLFPSSPARYGAWRDLPDGRAVGQGFVGGLAGALGGDSVAAALDGLHGLFGGMGAAGGGGGGSAGMGGAGQSIQVVINNPVGEPAEVSLTRQMRNLAAVGVI